MSRLGAAWHWPRHSTQSRSYSALLSPIFRPVAASSALTSAALPLAEGCDAACAFVNAEIDRAVVEGLVKHGIKVLAMRCAGYNNVDFKAAYDAGLTVVRVPAYSPYAVAEHAAALLLSLNRHIHKAAARTRDFNFSLAGLTGFDLHGKTAGIVGTGKIGRIFADICKGFGMRVLAYDAFPNPASGLEYVTLDKLLAESDVVSLHCPLLPDTKHLINAAALAKAKRGFTLINTSRGSLISETDVCDALQSGKLAGYAADVASEEPIRYKNPLMSAPNCLLTSHYAWTPKPMRQKIIDVSAENLSAFLAGKPQNTVG